MTADSVDTPTHRSAPRTRSKPRRIASIDAVRGLVMLIMTVDHSRETFFLHQQVTDPMQLPETSPPLFFTRLSSHVCAPAFVLLAGVSAALYASARRASDPPLATFLVRRGLLLLGLELSVIAFAWTGQLSPFRIWLQVLWALGGSMLCLAAAVAVGASRRSIGAKGLALVLGHNLLSRAQAPAGAAWEWAWKLLHERATLVADGPLQLKVTYPILPWIGVMFLGYAAGVWFIELEVRARRMLLLRTAAGSLVSLTLLRGTQIYGEPTPWRANELPIDTLMSWLNFTKYPPSLDFLLFTGALSCLVLALFDALPPSRLDGLRAFGGAPLFYYVAHLYALLGLQRLCVYALGANHAGRYGFAHIGSCWLVAAALAAALYFPCRWLGQLKGRQVRSWLRYL